MTKKTVSPEIWCGMIPNIYGYGIVIFETSEELAKKSLRKHFLAFKKGYGGILTQPKAMEYYGGRIFQVEMDKLYYDNIGE